VRRKDIYEWLRRESREATNSIKYGEIDDEKEWRREG
jgi:hypothetical protein